MNRKELGEILDREGINPNAYALDGGHPSERHVIDNRPAGWVVYYSERGLESGRHEFDTEDAACRYLLDQLRNNPTTHFHLVVGPLPATEADAAFEAWKKAFGLTDIDPADMKVDNAVFSDGPARRFWVRGTRLRSIGHSARMAAGQPGDDPITDIVSHRLPVFSPAVDVLVAEIVALGGRREIEERYGAFYWGPPSFRHELDSLRPMPPDLEDELRAIRDRLEREGRAGGWEIGRLLDEARRGRGTA